MGKPSERVVPYGVSTKAGQAHPRTPVASLATVQLADNRLVYLDYADDGRGNLAEVRDVLSQTQRFNY